MELIKLETFTKKNIEDVSLSITQDVLDGNSNPVHVLTQAKALTELCKKVIEDVKTLAVEEAAKYSKNDSVFNGAEFSLSNTGDTLTYEQDAEYAELNNKLKARKKLLKSAYDLYKNSGQTVIDEHGEIVKVVGIKKESEQIIKISFK